MSENYHIIIESGVDVGRKLVIPPDGVRVGRSSKNDISINDPMLSRHHCRIFYKDGGLWITDLGSANETEVNGEAITEAPINRGDTITIGDTNLKVVDDGRPQHESPTSDSFDLGLNAPATVTEAPRKKIGTGTLITALIVVCVLAAGAFIIKGAAKKPKSTLATVSRKVAEEDKTLTVEYEKIEATPQNIFYYNLRIKPDRTIAIAIDDLQHNRSVRNEKRVDPELIASLADFLEQSGFLEMQGSYEGLTSPEQLKQKTITITIGKRTKTIRVTNRVEPDVFAVVRQKLEDFGQVELGIWAIQFSTEKLIGMAKDSYLLGKKLYAERMVALGNLFKSIKSFKEAEWYLETVEQKPDFFEDILASRRKAIDELNRKYKEHNFATERAIKLRDWHTAATELKTLLELIPDREDTRNKEARKKLIEVDARMERDK